MFCLENIIYFRVFWKKVRWMDYYEKNDKTERARGLGRRTREETEKGNQMTALRFQAWGRIRHPLPPCWGSSTVLTLVRALKVLTPSSSARSTSSITLSVDPRMITVAMGLSSIAENCMDTRDQGRRTPWTCTPQQPGHFVYTRNSELYRSLLFGPAAWY